MEKKYKVKSKLGNEYEVSVSKAREMVDKLGCEYVGEKPRGAAPKKEEEKTEPKAEVKKETKEPKK